MKPISTSSASPINARVARERRSSFSSNGNMILRCDLGLYDFAPMILPLIRKGKCFSAKSCGQNHGGKRYGWIVTVLKSQSTVTVAFLVDERHREALVRRG